jgi:anti-anti-sigma regulatory factor
MEQKQASRSRKGKETVINGGKQLTIETISDFTRLIRDALAENTTVVVEFEPDLEVDITALQVFCSACKTASAQGKKFIHRGPPPQALIDLSIAAGIQDRKHCMNGDAPCFHMFGGK